MSANLMLQSATNRLKYWQDELTRAIETNNLLRAQECARFVEEYGTLIANMTIDAAKDQAP